ncbi:rhomboid-like protein [Streptomyces sp. NBC_00467]|uniref:rhomboid-like protein n=1 Tax=Streptomyces sp. NBC_00467 TaxID=2975752 RepID=UPI003FA7450E
MHQHTKGDRTRRDRTSAGDGAPRARTTPERAHGGRTDPVLREQAVLTELLPAIPAQRTGPVRAAQHAAVSFPAAGPLRTPWWRQALRLLPTPTGTPFTFGYLLVLLATSLYARHGDPATVSALLHGSSTDVAHLAHRPLLVLGASALWIAGGLASPYAIAFVVVLTALERRIGGPRTALVFLVGHVGATLATEVPVGISVAAGHLPATSLHRLDYGISFGLMASIGALAGLLSPVLRVTVLGFVAMMLLQDLLAFTDPLTDWGHPLALLAGLACWSAVRRWAGRSGSRTPVPV